STASPDAGGGLHSSTHRFVPVNGQFRRCAAGARASTVAGRTKEWTMPQTTPDDSKPTRQARARSAGTQRLSTVVVGGGAAGLVMGYYLRRAGRPFVILEADGRIGDTWRRHYDSLRLF